MDQLNLVTEAAAKKGGNATLKDITPSFTQSYDNTKLFFFNVGKFANRAADYSCENALSLFPHQSKNDFEKRPFLLSFPDCFKFKRRP